MRLKKAHELLGIEGDPKSAEVKARFHALAQLHHPDHGGDAGIFMSLRDAYNAAMQHALRDRICKACNGDGNIALSRGFARLPIICGDCRGTGKET